MIDVTDRVAENVNSFTMIKSDGSSEKVILISNETPVIEGTPINRKVLMDIQGFYNGETVTEDNIVTTTYEDGSVLTSTVEDNVITTRFVGSSGRTIQRKTTINGSNIITTIEELGS